jgi:hypothetical protein
MLLLVTLTLCRLASISIPRQALSRKLIIIPGQFGVCPSPTSLDERFLQILRIPGPGLRRYSISPGLQQTSRDISHSQYAYNPGEPVSMATTTDMITHLKKVLNRELLAEVRSLWFQHFNSESFILPGQDELKRWFSKDVELDRACVYASPSF